VSDEADISLEWLAARAAEEYLAANRAAGAEARAHHFRAAREYNQKLRLIIATRPHHEGGA